MVCMATDGAMSVEGGNWRIFEGMVEASGAVRALGTKVGQVSRKEEGGFEIMAGPAGSHGPGEVWTAEFDEVVLAAPYQFAGIEWRDVLDHTPDAIPYVDLHVTLFTSRHRLDPAAFGLKTDEQVPRMLLTTTPLAVGCNRQPDFLSISLLKEVHNRDSRRTEYAYKIFSMQPIDDSFFRRVLGLAEEGHGEAIDTEDISWIYRKLWQSYPYELPRVTFERIKLGDKVWYTSGIESLISTMETSSLMGMNVARLMVDEWTKAEEATLSVYS